MDKIKKLTIIMIAACTVFLASCDGSSGSDGDDYDYHDAAGNGYNDEDVDWNGGGDDGIGWDQAVNDWDRDHGIY